MILLNIEQINSRKLNEKNVILYFLTFTVMRMKAATKEKLRIKMLQPSSLVFF